MSIQIKLLLTALCSLLITIAQAETLKIATYQEQYPPFVFKDDQGNLSGFEVELGYEICKEIEVKCEFIQANISEFFPMLANKKINFIMAALDLTEERLKLADAAHVYIYNSASFVKLKSNNIQFIQGGLIGKKAGVKKNTSYRDLCTTPYNFLKYPFNLSEPNLCHTEPTIK